MGREKTQVEIYGAGPAGLVAAINLAREGFDVYIFDQQRQVGGNTAWHPSIQTTVLDQRRTWDYIGVDLSECFHAVDSITFYRHGHKKTFKVKHMYACERGPREGSLDNYLYMKALDAGVSFHPLIEFDPDGLDPGQNVIVATGLEANVYRRLEIPYVPIVGYRSVKATRCRPRLISYFSKWTNYDFAYLAADRGLFFALLFSRQRLPQKSLETFQQRLAETENLQFSKWSYSTGAIPLRVQLFHENFVLAGTLSGMIDPFLLHGISGALTSGKIASQTFVDRKTAVREFRWLAKNHETKQRLKTLSMRLPFKKATFSLLMWIDSRLRGVGFL